MADEKKPTEATKKAEPAKKAETTNNEVEELKKKLAEAEKARKEAEDTAKKAEAETTKTEEVEEAVVAKKVKLIRVKFMDEHTMYYQGKSKTFPKGSEAEVDQFVANKLFQRKIAMVIG